MPKTTAPKKTPSPQSQGTLKATEEQSSTNPTSVFVTMALDMSWRLAIVVLLPIIAGFKLDAHFKSSPLLTIVGFVLAMAGTGLVMWQTLQVANTAPVSKKENK